MTGRELWQRWVAFWDRREGPESLALVRILVGSVLALDFGGMAARGLVPDLWLVPPRGLAWVAAGDEGLLGLLGRSPVAVTSVWALALGGASCVAAGVLLRPAALGCVLATSLLAALAPDGERAIDMLLRIVLIVIACSRADAVWSLSRCLARRQGRAAPATIPAWPRLLLFAQLVWVYFSAAQNRGGSEWWPQGGFVALSRVLSDPHFARFSPGWTAAVEPLSRIFTALTLCFELGSPLIVLFTYADRHHERFGAFGRALRRFHLRWVWIALGASLHLGIALTMKLGIFPFGMLALYPIWFLPEELRAFVARARRVSARVFPNAARAPG